MLVLLLSLIYLHFYFVFSTLYYMTFTEISIFLDLSSILFLSFILHNTVFFLENWFGFDTFLLMHVFPFSHLCIIYMLVCIYVILCLSWWHLNYFFKVFFFCDSHSEYFSSRFCDLFEIWRLLLIEMVFVRITKSFCLGSIFPGMIGVCPVT